VIILERNVKQAASNSDLDMLVNRMKSSVAPLRDTLRDLHARYAPLMSGTVASYIPELAKMDPKLFGISVATVDGQLFDVGDYQQQFTIQSVSKPFTYGLALEDHGLAGVLAKVGVEPTGEAFNAIVLDEISNRPFNPMVNAGAIAVADLVKGVDLPDRVNRMIRMFSNYAGRDLHVDNSVYMSERATGHRNRAIAHLMLNFGMVSDKIDDALELYFQQCSILVTCHDLAVMGATLANGGVNPLTGKQALPREYVKNVLSIMFSCGMYDYAGQWGYSVGIPAKSGVGGGIVAVVPGQIGIGLFSPALDVKGNSVRGIKVCEDLSQRFGLHSFEAGTAESLAAQLKRVRQTSPS